MRASRPARVSRNCERLAQLVERRRLGLLRRGQRVDRRAQRGIALEHAQPSVARALGRVVAEDVDEHRLAVAAPPGSVPRRVSTRARRRLREQHASGARARTAAWPAAAGDALGEHVVERRRAQEVERGRAPGRRAARRAAASRRRQDLDEPRRGRDALVAQRPQRARAPCCACGCRSLASAAGVTTSSASARRRTRAAPGARRRAAACAGSRAAAARRRRPAAAAARSASARRQTARRHCSVRTKRAPPASRSSDIAGSSPYGWRPTRSVGSGPCARTQSMKKRRAASSSARGEPGAPSARGSAPPVTAHSTRVQPPRGDVLEPRRALDEREQVAPDADAAARPRRSRCQLPICGGADLDVEAAARRAAAVARRGLGGVVGRRAGRREREPARVVMGVEQRLQPRRGGVRRQRRS